jgi:5-methylcytosine-specific restriction endonuclease McrBC GTP-binding regulatory subunit McrB
MNSKTGVHGSHIKIDRKPNIRPSYYRFTALIQKKQKENHPSKFRQYSTQQLKRQIENGAETIDKLIRIDKWDFCNQVKPAIEWGIKDDFWTLQIRSLASLRNRGSNGETKFTNIFDAWEIEKEFKKKKPAKVKFREDARNPGRKVLRAQPNGKVAAVWEN